MIDDRSCPECGNEAPVVLRKSDGPLGRTVLYECPECESVWDAPAPRTASAGEDA